VKALETSAFMCIWRAFRSNEIESRKPSKTRRRSSWSAAARALGEIGQQVEDLAGIVERDRVVGCFRAPGRQPALRARLPPLRARLDHRHLEPRLRTVGRDPRRRDGRRRPHRPARPPRDHGRHQGQELPLARARRRRRPRRSGSLAPRLSNGAITDQLRSSEEFARITTRMQRVHQSVGFVDAFTGAEMAECSRRAWFVESGERRRELVWHLQRGNVAALVNAICCALGK
jgi:hypothetical protein